MNERLGTHSPVIRILLLDLLLMSAINAFFVIVIKGYRFDGSAIGERYIVLLILLNLLWILVTMVITRYHMDVEAGFGKDLKKILINIILFTGLISIAAYIFKEFKFSRIIIYGTLAGFFAGINLLHFILLKAIGVWRIKNPINKKILIVGNDHSALDLSNALDKNKDTHYDIVVFIESDELRTEIDERLILGNLADAQTVFQRYKIDELFIVLATSEEEEVKSLVEAADFHGARVRMVPIFYKLFQRNFDVKRVGDFPIINVNEIPLDNYYSALNKRVFDIVFSSIALMLCLPLLVVIALLVKLTSVGPVFYIPDRVGVGGTTFKLFKFRTMYDSSDDDDVERSTCKNDPRVTPLGRFLRRFDLDELPQFYNVLKGDMSVTGPRPHRVHLDKVLQNSVEKYMVRHYIKPGITGWAQINGWRGPTETEEQRVQRTEHDLWYIQNWNFRLDLKIIALTLLGRKARKNAF